MKDSKYVKTGRVVSLEVTTDQGLKGKIETLDNLTYDFVESEIAPEVGSVSLGDIVDFVVTAQSYRRAERIVGKHINSSKEFSTFPVSEKIIEFGTPCSPRCFKLSFLLASLFAGIALVMGGLGSMAGFIVFLAASLGIQLNSGVRRSKAIGWPAWATFGQLIPVVGLVLLIVLMVKNGARGLRS